jgi:PadR family transcriptional regulator, regulatory protein AphA
MTRKNRTRYVLLGLLANRARSGYDLKRAVEQSIGHFWHESYGQIYPHLKRLEEEGLAQVERIIEEGRPQRKLYRITEEGHEELRLWLEESVQESKPRNELLLKLFFGKRVKSEISISHLESFMSELEVRRQLLETIRGEMDDSLHTRADAKFWMMSLRFGILECEARIQWAKESLAILRDAEF